MFLFKEVSLGSNLIHWWKQFELKAIVIKILTRVDWGNLQDLINFYDTL